MIVGIPKEVKDNEYRVAATPEGVHELVRAGQEVLVEDGAGAGSSIPQQRYERAGSRGIVGGRGAGDALDGAMPEFLGMA